MHGELEQGDISLPANEVAMQEAWKSGDAKQIIDCLKNRSKYHGDLDMVSDYHYNTDDIIEELGLKSNVDHDEQIPELSRATNGNPLHFMVDLRKREIIMEHLLGLVEVMPGFDYDHQNNKWVILGDKQGKNTFDPNDMNALVNLATCTTEGEGYKVLGIDVNQVLDKDAYLANVEKNFGRSILDIMRRLDGKRRAAVLREVFAGNKEKLIRLFDAQNR